MEREFLSIQISSEQAAEMVQMKYHLKGEVIPLAGEIDFNFWLRTAMEEYLLKVSRPDEDIEYIEFQQALIDHVAKSEVELISPLCIPDISGRQISEITDKNGSIRKVRLLSWIDGRLWSSVNPISNGLLYSLGEQAGKLAKAMQGFDHPKAHRKLDWDIAGSKWCSKHFHLFNAEKKGILNYFKGHFDAFKNEYQALRKGLIHNDVNDNNIIVSQDLIHPKVRAIVDYGDAVYTQIINDLAIVIAYAIMDKNDPLAAALPIIKGYNDHFPIEEKELPFLYDLIAMRLVISVSKSAINKVKEPHNEYLQISEKPAWDLLEKWKNVNIDLAYFSFRQACGLTAHPNEKKFQYWTEKNPVLLSSLFPSMVKGQIHRIDLSVSSKWIGQQSDFNDLDLFQFKIDQLQKKHPGKIIAGGYLEPRPLYTSSVYDRVGDQGRESRSTHLGIDFWLPAQSPVHALFEGIIASVVNCTGDKDYGGLIIVKHYIEKIEFFTLYGHLSLASLEGKGLGQSIKKGERIGYLGPYPENGNWASHLHFQIMLTMLDYEIDFPGVIYPNEIDVWKSICPDPNLLFANKDLEPIIPKEDLELTVYRKKHLGKSLSLSYKEAITMVRGSGVYLIDSKGRKYLDTVNNVAHVGHEHPRVVKAGQAQMALLNTNTRYLNENILDFSKELLSTFPKELSVVHLVNSGSEANELALRMAKTYSGQKDMIAVEIGYHGNSNACIDISSYKFNGKGGKGAPEHTHIVPLPDAFRGIYQGENKGEKYAAHIQEQIDLIQSKGRNIAAFICESIISCGGQIELPENYLKIAYKAVRNAGGLCIADEVQTGCGRIGSHFWAFQQHDVIPDIVTIGKPIGNGHPLAAVVCTQEVAEAFANGMEYFNTFGGNPVSSAIGLEVLKVIKEEKLQENALKVGSHLKTGLQELQAHFPIIGDVRGQGLFLGFELVDGNKNPLSEQASYLANRMKDFGILMSTDGKDNNALKIKPPMSFSKENADELLQVLRRVLKEDYMRFCDSNATII